MKFKLTMTVTTEYEVHPEFYDVKEPEAMLNTDIESMKDDPYIFLEMEETKIDVKGEIINETDSIKDV